MSSTRSGRASGELGLVRHLPPLGGRVDRDDQPPGVDLELVAAGVVVPGQRSCCGQRISRTRPPSPTTIRVPSPLTTSRTPGRRSP
ncbi:hypothetical protein HBB16_02945 [Pseudonocardia sp. MCCB 268]|nr:hypothetical protein [Pseudonocardia cytotoxica]